MHTLLSHDIIPDLGVTVESDLATYEALTLLPERARNIPLIAAAQVHPKTFELFDQSAVYFKSEATYSAVFATGTNAIAQGTPSAFNAALTVALWYKLPNVFTVGCDFGFKDPRQSHADGAFYYQDNELTEKFEAFKAQIAKSAYFLEENDNGKIYTTPFYNTCNRHTTRAIMLFQRQDVRNLSLGATIEGVPFSPVSELEETLATLATGGAKEAGKKIFAAAQPKRKKQVRQALDEMKGILRDISTQALAIVEQVEPNMESIEVALFHLGKLAGNSPKVNGRRMSILRGTIWHWSYNFYALCKKIHTDEDRLGEIVRLWKQHYGHFLARLPEHFEYFLSDTENVDDPRLQLTISQSEPNIDQWLLGSLTNPDIAH